MAIPEDKIKAYRILHGLGFDAKKLITDFKPNPKTEIMDRRQLTRQIKTAIEALPESLGITYEEVIKTTGSFTREDCYIILGQLQALSIILSTIKP